MERRNELSNNLRAYKAAQNKTLSEISREFDVARSTLQSIMEEGNTTIDTAIRMANAKGITLDELVFGKITPNYLNQLVCLLNGMEWYAGLSEEMRSKVLYHLDELVKLVCDIDDGE